MDIDVDIDDDCKFSVEYVAINTCIANIQGFRISPCDRSQIGIKLGTKHTQKVSRFLQRYLC